MRITALLAGALLVAGCSRAEAPQTDTATADGALSLSSFAGSWDVVAMPPDRDTVVASYVLDATDPNGAWTMTFPDREPVAATASIAGDGMAHVVSAAYESVLRPGVQVTTEGHFGLEDGKIAGTVVARYQTSSADSVVTLRFSGTKR